MGCGPQVGPFPSRPIMGSIRGEGTPPTNPSHYLKKEISDLPLKWLLKEGPGRSPTAVAAAARLHAAATTAATPCPGHGSSPLSSRRRCRHRRLRSPPPLPPPPDCRTAIISISNSTSISISGKPPASFRFPQRTFPLTGHPPPRTSNCTSSSSTVPSRCRSPSSSPWTCVSPSRCLIFPIPHLPSPRDLHLHLRSPSPLHFSVTPSPDPYYAQPKPSPSLNSLATPTTSAHSAKPPSPSSRARIQIDSSWISPLPQSFLSPTIRHTPGFPHPATHSRQSPCQFPVARHCHPPSITEIHSPLSARFLASSPATPPRAPLLGRPSSPPCNSEFPLPLSPCPSRNPPRAHGNAHRQPQVHFPASFTTAPAPDFTQPYPETLTNSS